MNSKPTSLIHILYLSVFILFCPSTYAVDVFALDIKGVKLGMTAEEVLKLFPNSKPEISYNYDDDTDLGNRYRFEHLGLWLETDREGRVYQVYFREKFEVKPDFEKIAQRLQKKYGKPSRSAQFLHPDENTESFCWGECYARKSSHPRSTGEYLDFDIPGSGKKETTGLIASYNEPIPRYGSPYFVLELNDGKRSEENYQIHSSRYQAREKRKKELAKEKATNFDF